MGGEASVAALSTGEGARFIVRQTSLLARGTQSGFRDPLCNPATPIRIGNGPNPTIVPSLEAPCKSHMISSTSSFPTVIVPIAESPFHTQSP